MLNKLKRGLVTAMAALVLMPAVAAASTVSVSSTRGHEAVKLPDFLSPIAGQSLGSTSVPRISFNAAFGLPEFLPLEVVPRNPPSLNLRRSIDLSLWSLVATVNAQQRGDSFELVEVSVAALPLSQPNVDPLSAVPLPPAVWLFVMGALGLAGTRITGLSGGARKAGDSTPARDLSRHFGGALPA